LNPFKKVTHGIGVVGDGIGGGLQILGSGIVSIGEGIGGGLSAVGATIGNIGNE